VLPGLGEERRLAGAAGAQDCLPAVRRVLVLAGKAAADLQDVQPPAVLVAPEVLAEQAASGMQIEAQVEQAGARLGPGQSRTRSG
jgi:hypothetical protein